MPDLVAPTLTSLSFSTTINLQNGSTPWTVTAEAFDAGSDIDKVVVWFDRPLVTDIGSFNLIVLSGSGDSWSDGRSTSNRIVLDANNPGIVAVTKVTVSDLAGNTRTYLPAELQALGIATQVDLVGSALDNIPPTLGSLSFSTTINLQNGSTPWTVTAEAFDAGSDIDKVVVWFDRPLVTDIGSFNLIVLSGSGDSWSDGRSTSNRIVLDANNPGIVAVTKVTVSDLAGNTRTYLPAELQALGIATQVDLVGSALDNIPPTLGSLSFSTTINLQNGSTPWTVTAEAFDAGSDIDKVVVWFDRPLVTDIGSFNLIVLSGSGDSWSDGRSTSNRIVLDANNPGIVAVTKVTVSDLAGNTRTYLPAELQALGIATQVDLVGSASDPEPPISSPYDDVLIGTTGSEILAALAGNDTISPGTGDDTVDGGPGNDVVVYNALRSAVSLNRASDISIQIMGDAVGLDTLISVERIDLTDGDFVFDVAGNSAQVIYRLYQAAFARTPDESGFRYWASAADTYGLSPLQIAREFRIAPEFAAKYGVNVSNRDYTYNMYKNVLGREPDQGGIDYWTNVVNIGWVTRDQLLIEFAQSPENIALTAPNTSVGYWVV